MKISEIVHESASAGATGSGSIAGFVSPMGSGSVIKRPNPSIYATKKSKPKKKKAKQEDEDS
tara:strand:+ start:1434 stop:1619 length:186 start_codon:yes stop_codon:yes gene_type:complete